MWGFLLLSLWVVAHFSTTAFAAVTLKVSGLAVEVSNDLVQFHFKTDSTISSLYVNEENIVSGASRSFYLDWTGANGEIRLQPSSVEVVEQSDSRAHFYWVQESSITADALRIELHYILEDALSGIYCYAKYSNDKSETVTFGETRTIYRFKPSLLTKATNQFQSDTLPTEAELDKCEVVQDSTYKFPNGTYYSKYDYAVYIRESQYHGIYGNGYGAFVISPSKDYHAGGAMKQDLTVHQYSLITNYFMSAHFGSPAFEAPPGWVHLYGPFLVYLPTGDDTAIIADVQKQVQVEQVKWPYSFVDDEEYPLKRGSISGTVSGQSNATITLYDSINEQYDLQQLGYLYSTRTDSSGYYSIDNIRPGAYKVVAYPLAGYGSENLAEDTVVITADEASTLDLNLPEPQNILWSLGEANRRSNEFKYADQPRNYKWEFEPPKTTTFTVGESDPKVDWYYAQAQPGTWYVKYQDTSDGKGRTLRVPLAGAKASNLVITLNGNKLADLDLTNDASVYRSAMQSGRYRSYVLEVQPEYVVSGENVLEFTVTSGAVMYDAISLQINE